MSLPLARAARDAARLAQREGRYQDAERGWSLAVSCFDATVLEAQVPSQTGHLVRQRDHAAVMLLLTRAVVSLHDGLKGETPCI
jgi:hypothetical protein